MHHVAVAVGHDLQFDMARLVEIFLDIDSIVAEGRPGFRPGEAPGFFQPFGAGGDLHAASTTAGGGFDQHGVANAVGDLGGFVQIFHRANRAGHQRHAQGCHGHLGFDLIAHHADMRRRRTDEGEAMGFDHFGEAGIFRQKAVAGMDGIGAGDAGGGQNRGDVEVAVAGRGRADADAFIGQTHMHRLGIRGGVHRDGGDAEFPARALDAQRDLTAIGDQDFTEHAVIPGSAAAARIRPAGHRRPGCG